MGFLPFFLFSFFLFSTPSKRQKKRQKMAKKRQKKARKGKNYVINVEKMPRICS